MFLLGESYASPGRKNPPPPPFPPRGGPGGRYPHPAAGIAAASPGGMVTNHSSAASTARKNDSTQPCSQHSAYVPGHKPNFSPSSPITSTGSRPISPATGRAERR